MRLSIVIPVFNEEKTIVEVVRRVLSVPLPVDEREIIIVDDGSTDATATIVAKSKIQMPNVKIIKLDKNQGKGAAVRRGFAQAAGDAVIIQDADLEYAPADMVQMLEPFLAGKADVVYGSRFVTNRPRRVLYNTHYLANRLITLLSNIFSGLNLSDIETGYKLFSASALRAILPCLTATRFGIEVELTAQIAKHRFRVYEVGISYNGRTYEEGKKIGWSDGLAALWHIVRYNVFTRS